MGKSASFFQGTIHSDGSGIFTYFRNALGKLSLLEVRGYSSQNWPPSSHLPPTEKYILRGDETYAVLHRLASHGKKLFLITNSPFSFVWVPPSTKLTELIRDIHAGYWFGLWALSALHIICTFRGCWLTSFFSSLFRDKGMKYMVGKDWRDLFDIVIVQADKPHFFNSCGK